MLRTEITISRSSGLWGGVSPETVKRYREELEELRKQLNQFDFLHYHNLFGSDELMKAVKAEIEDEIKYCLFYDEYRSREASDLGKWVLAKQEDIEPDDWRKPLGEQWAKTNGRIKAIIQFNRTGTMVKITLEYRNDSKHLNFYERPYNLKLPTARVRIEDSINAKVQELKEEADAFMEEHHYPSHSQHEADLLKQLLHLGREEK